VANENEYKHVWDKLSSSFDGAAFHVCCLTDEQEIRRNGALTADFLKRVLQLQPDHKVLEIGCGIGRVGRELAPDCGEWHGADISGNMIRHAGQRMSGIKNAFLYELPANDLGVFNDQSFDAVYATIVFMHLDKLDVFRYIREAYRVLKSPGTAYFDTYNLLAPQGWQEFLKILAAFPSKRPGHVSQFCTPQEMRKFVSEAGFSQIEIGELDPQLVTARCKRLPPG